MSLKIQHKILISALAVILIAGCASGGKARKTTAKGAVPQEHPLSKSGNPASYAVFGKTYRLLPTSKGYVEEGMASWYGDKFHGKPTSSGTPYDMHAYTAAHKTLPIPSYVIVTNTETKKSITVLVNDRGPFVKGRIIDLSLAAAKELNVVQKGTAPVRVEAVGPYQYLDPSKKPRLNPVTKITQSDTNEPSSSITNTSTIANHATTPNNSSYAYVDNAQSPEHYPTTSTTSTPDFVVLEQQGFDGSPNPAFIESSYSQQSNQYPSNSHNNENGYHIQLGSFGSEQNARNFQQNMNHQLNQTAQVKYDKGLYRVYIGTYNSREEAGNAAFSIPVPTTITHF